MSSEGDKIVGRIYKIISSETGNIYVGSTIQLLSKRLNSHKSDYKSYLKGEQHYCSSFEIVKYVDARIVLLHEELFDSVADLRRLEGEYILQTANCINKCIAGRSNIESSRNYRLNNPDKARESKDKYRSNHREQIQQQNKEYRDANRERINNTNKEYYLANKERIDGWRNAITQCSVCGKGYKNANKSKHLKSVFHISSLSQSATDASSNSTITD